MRFVLLPRKIAEQHRNTAINSALIKKFAQPWKVALQRINMGVCVAILASCAELPLTPISNHAGVVDLTEKAELARTEGNLQHSASFYERALRMEGSNPQLWYRLAKVNYELKRYDNAENCAKRGLSYVNTNPALRFQLENLVRLAQRNSTPSDDS